MKEIQSSINELGIRAEGLIHLVSDALQVGNDAPVLQRSSFGTAIWRIGPWQPSFLLSEKSEWTELTFCALRNHVEMNLANTDAVIFFAAQIGQIICREIARIVTEEPPDRVNFNVWVAAAQQFSTFVFEVEAYAKDISTSAMAVKVVLIFKSVSPLCENTIDDLRIVMTANATANIKHLGVSDANPSAVLITHENNLVLPDQAAFSSPDYSAASEG